MDHVENAVQGDMVSLEKAERDAELEDDYKKKKFITLFKARTILAKIGTMPERQLCRKQLRRMKKHGIKSI
jgi:hypothetical protein